MIISILCLSHLSSQLNISPHRLLSSITSLSNFYSTMLLGNRQRPPIKRTTSMAEFTLDLTFTGEVVANSQPSDPSSFNPIRPTRNNRRNSGDFSESTHFLRSCAFCKRRLFSGRDIFMYRGDSAFCSLECRKQQILQDERKEKCSVASMKEVATSMPTLSTESELASTSAVAVVAMV